MNVKAIRMNALSRLELASQKHKPTLKSKDSLKGHKQNTALKLLEREEQNARRSRMLSLLTQQFIGKYGSKAPSSRINAFIKATIADFLNSYSNMTVAESMIESMEVQIKDITDKMKSEINQVRTDSRQEQQLQRQQEQLKLKLIAQNKAQASTGSRRPSAGDLAQSASGTFSEPSWAMLNAISAAEAEAKENEKKAKKERAAQQYKLDLDAQRDSLRSMNNQDDQDKREQHQMNLKVKAAYEKDLEEKARKAVIFKAQERDMRMTQIEYNEMLRAKERQMKILAEQGDMARSRRLAQAEADAAQMKKDKAAAAVEKVKAENEENKRLKEIAKQKQWDYEAKLNKDYEAKLEREEAARKKAFDDRVAALKKFESGGASVAAAKESMLADEMTKTMAEIEAKYERDAQKLEEKKVWRKQEMVNSRQFNMTLIERKKAAKEAEKQADIERRRQQQIELDAENERNAKKKEAKFQQMAELKRKLDEQVDFRHRSEQFGKASLSSEEIEYNKKIIKKLESDPNLFRQVMQKVNPTPRGGVGEFKYG